MLWAACLSPPEISVLKPGVMGLEVGPVGANRTGGWGPGKEIRALLRRGYHRMVPDHDLGPTASKTERSKRLLLISHPVEGILLQQPKLTKVQGEENRASCG